MKHRAIIGLAAALVATALVIGGCGDSDDTTALTKQQFTKQANAICVKSDEERKAAYRAANSGVDDSFTDAENEELIREVFVEPYGQMLEELEELGIPEGDEQEVEAIFAAMEDGLNKVEKDPLSGLSEVAMFDKANKLSTKYGLTGCLV